jgi:serine/threonine-protein kinase
VAQPTSYTRVCEISQGGMGYVELVFRRDGFFRRFYARKRLHAQHRSDPAFRAMFMDEARLAGLISHPNVVGVLEMGEDEEGPFLISDFVDGVAVGKILGRVVEQGGRVPLQVALRIAIDAARGLHAAHEVTDGAGKFLGLVHRDVSPNNVLVGFDGTVRVTDFGIAKALGNFAHTSTGLLKGNAGYLSPEQLRFEEPDRRSDLFSLGVVLYELVAGTRLYASTGGTDGARRILNDPPPDLADTRPDVPDKLVELSFELLAKQREKRPQTALAVASRLEAILAGLIAQEGVVDLREHMTAHFGDLGAQQRAVRQKYLERLSADESEGSAPPSFASATSATTMQRPVARTRPARAAIAVAVAVALLGAGAWLGRSRGRAPDTAPPPAPLPTAAPHEAEGQPLPGATRTLWAGGWHTCALQGRALYCWGKNNEGQTGSNSTLDRPTRSRPGTLEDVSSVGLGFFHTCACTRDGRAHCWGRNVDGQLGNGSTTPSLVPVDVTELAGCTQITAGSGHTCALSSAGAVSCWGSNAQGQLGKPGPAPALAPVPVVGLEDVAEVQARGEFSCARRISGAVLCWGSNSHGQLGDGATAERSTPAPVIGVDDAVEIALGRRFACARRRAGTVVCWGENFRGQLGGGPGPNRRTAVAVAGIADAVQIGGGSEHACALRRGGILTCWGGNGFGQLGLGAAGDPSLPRDAVPIGSPYLSVAVGEVHTCARHLGGVVCWGRNGNAQVGDGSTDDRARPVSVTGFREYY